ncbi:MAG: winged helix-turn-helix transcriptional regulator [Burkholderiaceae bacterium]|nr:MAG: winged helix-turn-helix transcriptional regulator [Burkholderiaceae bacterium]
MRKTKADQLTDVVLTLFQLNGALVDWGDAFVAPEGLTSARWQMLGALALAGQPLTAPQVGARMGVSRQGAQKQLHLLAQSGLIEVRANPQHKRSPLHALTAPGLRIYDAIAQRWQARAQGLAAPFSAEELRTTAQVLSALLALHAPAGGAPESTDEA